jgi:hypothetical protein
MLSYRRVEHCQTIAIVGVRVVLSLAINDVVQPFSRRCFMSTQAKEVFIRFTVSQANIPPRLEQFSKGVDNKEGPAVQPKEHAGNGIRIYAEPLPNRSLVEFLDEMGREYELVFAWYEARVDRNNSKKTYHICTYVFALREGAKSYFRFSPVRPAIRAELGELVSENAWTVRSFYDNPRFTESGQLDRDFGRWEIQLNGRQPLAHAPSVESLPFRGVA